MHHLRIFSCAFCLALPALVRAETVSANATTNATVQTAGVRSGSNGLAFFNVEGVPAFASFGVLDFTTSSFNLAFPVTAVSTISLSLTESNAAFTTASGGLAFYLVTDTTTNIVAGTSTLTYQSSVSPSGLGAQLGSTPYLLGTGTFSTNSGTSGSGTVDNYGPGSTLGVLSLSGDAQSYLLTQLNTASALIRLVVVPTDTTGASTWAGATNSNASTRPKLTLDLTLNQPTLTWIGGNGTWNATGGGNWSGGAWDPTKTALFSSGSGEVALGSPITALGVTFNTTGYTISGTGANVLTLASGAGGNVVAVSSAADMAVISAEIAGTSGLSKNGAGTLTLTGANSFTGNVTINAGTLAVGSNSNFGDAANGITFNGGTLKSTTAFTVGSARTLSGSGTIDSSAGALTFSGPINASALIVSGGSTVTFAGPTVAFASAALGAGSQLNVSSPISTSGRTTFTGDGSATLSGNNSAYGGGISMSRGAGTVGPNVNISSATALGTNTLFLNAGKLTATGSLTGGAAIATVVSLGGSATLSGNMEFSSFGFFGSTAKRLTITDNVTISGTITSDNTTTNALNNLIKAGAGKLTLTAFNNYAATQLLAGTLEITSTGTLGTGSTTISAEDTFFALLRLDSNESVDDLSNVYINNTFGSSLVDLNFDVSLFETVNSLTVNGISIAPGTYNASTLPDYLTGTGNLIVTTTVPEPQVTFLLFGGIFLTGWVALRRRFFSCV